MAKITIHKIEPAFTRESFIHSLSTVKTLEGIQEKRDFLYTTREINRRLKKNRAMILQLEFEITKRAYELIDEGVTPF